MSEPPVENVLVVPTELFHGLGHFQGFTRETDRYLPVLLDPANMQFRPRNQVEEDPGLKQLIPYVIFLHRNGDGAESVFQYTRGRGQGEGRLHHLRSVGIGGHISSTDVGKRGQVPFAGNGPQGASHKRVTPFPDPFQEGMRRELDEEVAIDTPYRARCVGLLNDDSNPVGQVHLGLVHIFEVERPAVRSRETEIIESGFRPVAQIMAALDEFETWSQISMRALFE
ncbi:MAG: phosphoesterase [Pirellulales bacterium]|nr:phosphoesterase [Pirellulales bacterium]